MTGLTACVEALLDVAFSASTWVGRTSLEALTSATFWAAMEAIGTVGALYFIYRQIASSRATAAYEFVRKEGDRFSSEEMKKDRSILAQTLLRHPDQWEVIEAHATEVIDYFEDLGLMVRTRVAPVYFVWTTSYDYIMHYWQALAGYVDWVRDKEKDGGYFIEFEHLYKSVLSQERRVRRRDVEPIGKGALRHFLQEEVHIDIRRVDASDLDAVIEIEGRSFTSEAYSMQTFKKLAKDHPDGFFVATNFDRVVGYAVGYLDGTIGEIDSMAVEPAFWRFGVGRKLFGTVCLFLEQQGAETLGLEVRPGNHGAIQLYEGFGFVVSERIEDFYGRGEPAYRMSRAAGGRDGVRQKTWRRMSPKAMS